MSATALLLPALGLSSPSRSNWSYRRRACEKRQRPFGPTPRHFSCKADIATTTASVSGSSDHAHTPMKPSWPTILGQPGARTSSPPSLRSSIRCWLNAPARGSRKLTTPLAAWRYSYAPLGGRPWRGGAWTRPRDAFETCPNRLVVSLGWGGGGLRYSREASPAPSSSPCSWAFTSICAELRQAPT